MTKSEFYAGQYAEVLRAYDIYSRALSDHDQHNRDRTYQRRRAPSVRRWHDRYVNLKAEYDAMPFHPLSLPRGPGMLEAEGL